MVRINNLNNSSYNIGFGNKTNAQYSLAKTLHSFENRIIANEQAVTGCSDKEVICAIEDKFSRLIPQTANLTQKRIEELGKPLEMALKQNEDITSLYIVLGDFEKKLSQV